MAGENSFISATLARWITDDPAVRVLDTAWEWQPKWPAAVLAAALAGVWVLAVVIHRSRRIDLSLRWRAGLGLLRVGILAIPVLMLAQPNILARLERREPRTLAVLLDHSRSMSLADGLQAQPESRWRQAAQTFQQAIAEVVKPPEGSGPLTARPVSSAPKVVTYLFGESIHPASSQDLAGSSEPSEKGRTAIGQALRQVQVELAGKPTAGVLLLTDGADNVRPPDSPLAAARELARLNIPVYTCLVGNEHPREVAISAVAEAPFAFAGDPIPLRVNIEHQGFDQGVATVNLTEGDRTLQTREVTLPPGGKPVTERFEVQADQTGRKRYRLEAVPLPGELTTANNHAIVDVNVIDQPIRVLYLEHWPRWQYQFLRNALQRDHRFQPTLVLLTEDPSTPPAERQTASFPVSAEEMSRFDVIVVGDVAPQDLSPQQWEWLRDHVTKAGAGAVFIAGPMHTPAAFMDSTIAPLLPFERVSSVSEEDLEPFTPMVTLLGAHHPLIRSGFGDDPAAAWKQLPPLQWYAGVSELKPAAMVLAQRSSPGGGQSVPLIILQRVGKGSVLFVGTDETWKWRYQVGNRYFYGFWAHAIQHLGMPHRVGEFRPVRIEVADQRIAPDEPVGVSVAIDSATGTTEPGTGEMLNLLAEATEGGSPPVSFKLQQAADEPFLYEGQIQLARPGTYKLSVEGREGRGDAVVEVSADSNLDPELANAAVNPALLRQIAELTGGEFVRLDQLPSLLSRLDLSPLKYRWSQRIALWDGWTLLMILAVLLTAEWVLRKVKYLL